MAGDKTALVIGASGVSGWAFVNEILTDYPRAGLWKGCIAMTNRPLTLEQSHWPRDDRLKIVSGIDLLKGTQEELEGKMKEGFGSTAADVTHVFYVAYKAGSPQEYEENKKMFERCLPAIDKLCPNLEFVVVQNGSKYSGSTLVGGKRPDYIKAPISEDVKRIDYGNEPLFYYDQLDFIEDYSKDKRWGWADTRPDIVVGFVPNQNFFSLGMSLGIFLSLWREINGPGAECPFPGSTEVWRCKSTDASSDMIARQTLHIAFTEPFCKEKGHGFNVGDAKSWDSWEKKWAPLCGYFGLKGTKLPDGEEVPEVRKYIRENFAKWEEMEKKYGLQSGHADHPRIIPGFETFLLTYFSNERWYDMSKMYDQAGFKEERTALQAWGGVWDRMRSAKIIPSDFR